MSVIKDTLEAIQSVLVPKLAEISARLDGIEQRQSRDFDSLMRAIESLRVEVGLKLEVALLSEQLRQAERKNEELQKALPPATQ